MECPPSTKTQADRLSLGMSRYEPDKRSCTYREGCEDNGLRELAIAFASIQSRCMLQREVNRLSPFISRTTDIMTQSS